MLLMKIEKESVNCTKKENDCKWPTDNEVAQNLGRQQSNRMSQHRLKQLMMEAILNTLAM